MKEGLVISFSFAFFALFLATKNIIMAFMSCMTIVLIVINVIAQIPYFGWELGSSEAVGVVVCVGFAVDYVVHLASHFIHSKHSDRYNRIKESLREMGISIVGGSSTTILATVVLFICVILPFHKFAFFVISTIIFSLFYSLFFFPACCHVFGPNGNFCNIGECYNWIKFHERVY